MIRRSKNINSIFPVHKRNIVPVISDDFIGIASRRTDSDQIDSIIVNTKTVVSFSLYNDTIYITPCDKCICFATHTEALENYMTLSKILSD